MSNSVIQQNISSNSASSTKLVQQQVQGFIQGLSNEELSKLLEIFEKSLIPEGKVVKIFKMVQYKCYESKIDLNGKIGCGFGRSEDEALAISIKDFFDIILLEEKYLYLVKECFRQMKGLTQGVQGVTSSSLKSQTSLQSDTSQKSQINSTNSKNKKSDNNKENTLTECKQIIQEQLIQENNNICNKINQEFPIDIVDNQISLIEMQINESNVYELSKKIGNISVINGPNVIASTQFNNNSQQDIDEILLKIMFEEEKKQLQQIPANEQQQNQQNINFNQYYQNITNNKGNYGQDYQENLTQFQLYQMQYLQQQNNIQQQQQYNVSQQQQSQKIQQEQQAYNVQQKQQKNIKYQQSCPQQQKNIHLQQQLNKQQQQINLQQQNPEQIQKHFLQQPDNSDIMYQSNINGINQKNYQFQNFEDISEVNYENLSTPPNKNKKISFSNTNRGQQINQQLNDTAFMPTNIPQSNNNSTQNVFFQQKQLLRNNSLSNQYQRRASSYAFLNSQSNQSTQLQSYQSSTQQNSNIIQNSVQNYSNRILSNQSSFNFFTNKENAFQQQINSCQDIKLNNLPSQITQASLSKHSSKQNLHIQSQQISSSCCNHKEELERERNKVENLEKRIKLLIEENKILKSLVLDNQTVTSQQALKNKVSSNQTPRDSLYQTNVGTSSTKQINNQEQESIHRNKQMNNINITNTNIPNRTNQHNTRSLSQDISQKEQNNQNLNMISQYLSGQKKQINISESGQKNNLKVQENKNICNYGSLGKYDLEQQHESDLSICSHYSLNQNQSSVKKGVSNLNLEILPSQNGQQNHNSNNSSSNNIKQKYVNKIIF